jgi:hypothetical protein
LPESKGNIGVIRANHEAADKFRDSQAKRGAIHPTLEASSGQIFRQDTFFTTKNQGRTEEKQG